MRQSLAEVKSWVKAELDSCLDFWLKNGQDKDFGGVLTCLDREGKVYSTDKSVWMQGRCAWTFSKLCNVYGERSEWKAFAKSCLDFMEAHCINQTWAAGCISRSPGRASPSGSADTVFPRPFTPWPMRNTTS